MHQVCPVSGRGLLPVCESVTVHLSERKAWLIAVSWLQSEHVCWGDPRARRRGEGDMLDLNCFKKEDVDRENNS